MSYQIGDIVVEYAKSGRAKCKTCKGDIAKDSIRIGFAAQSPFHDGIDLRWNHIKCALAKVPDITLAKGFHDLKPADADKLAKKADAVGGPKSGATAAALSAGYTDQFVVDYAKSSRSTCAHCGNKIDQGEVRVGKNELITTEHFSGIKPSWHHLECVFLKEVVAVPEQIVEGISDLSAEDRDAVLQLIIEHSPLPQVKAMTVAAATGGKRKKSTDADATASTAKSKKSKKKSKDDDDDDGDDAETKDNGGAATVDYASMTVPQLKAECKAQNLAVSGAKAALIQRLTEAAKSAHSDTAAAMDTSADVVVSSSTSTTDEAALTALIRAESEAKWALKNKLKRALTNNDIKAILEHNDQWSKGGPDRVLDALVEGMLYGALPRCPDCGNRGLTFEDGMFKCKSVTEWSSCGYTADNVERGEWEIPEPYDSYEHLDKWTFDKQTKPIAALRHLANKSKVTTQQHNSAVSASQQLVEEKRLELLKQHEQTTVFTQLKIIVAGAKLDPSSAALKKMITDGGGEVVTDADDADLLVTTADNVKKPKGAALKDMIDEKKPILDVAFVVDSVAAAQLVDPASHVLNGADVTELQAHLKRQVEAREHRRLKSGSKSAASSSTTKSIGKSGGVTKVVLKGRGAVEEESGLSSSGHILDEGSDKLWSATLTITDITSNSNQYYILQLIENDNFSGCHVFRKWGRTGTTFGGTKLESLSKAAAKKEFERLFLEKTGNQWAQRGAFVKIPGKFNFVDVDYSDTADGDLDAEMAVESSSQLDARIQDFVKLIFSIDTMKAAMKEMSLDLDKMPLGKLSRDHIKRGYTALQEIQDLFSPEAAATENDFVRASSKFYSIIPHDFGTAPPTIINNQALLKEKLEIVEALMQMEVATSMLRSEKDKAVVKDPVDLHYEKLNTDMTCVERDSSTFKLIETYLHNTHAATHSQYDLELVDLFEIRRNGEYDRYKKHDKDENRQLLWHGSRTTNFVGILSQGLRIAPPEAPATGYMFGKGIYLADCSSKSANYCFTTSSNSTGCMLLCEAALGKMNELLRAQYMEKAPKGFDSTKGCGSSQPDPAHAVTLPDGVIVPCGPIVPSNVAGSSLLYNEYIVYDISQVHIRYLLKLNFKYKRNQW